ncbi:hypothetical protein F5Y03DRAFT_399085 [Xylaria venustula]|nr:hypothetical protein F5Y03DRAFT_399085 [Xylaria venustula]
MSARNDLPDTAAKWKSEYKSLAWKSIHEYGLACSGSEISREQFLLLRTLWVEHDAEELYARDRSLWIDDSSFKEAQQFLSSSAIALIWKQFLKSTRIHPHDLEREGYVDLHTFSLVRYHQAQSQDLRSEVNDSAKVDMSPIAKRTRFQQRLRLEAQSSPTPAPKLSGLEQQVKNLSLSNSTPDQPPTTPDRGSSLSQSRSLGDIPSPFEDPKVFKAIQDEQIVNTALIEYLNALAIHCTQLQANWTLHRLPLIARDHHTTKTYEARVDGYLRRRRDNMPLAIIEVKPFVRKTKQVQIRMQESAQMAAWINQHRPLSTSQPGGTNNKIKRLLISQDRHRIYLNFASFDTNYVDYICDKQGIDHNAVSFLTMHEYGPFDVGDETDMSMLGELVLGYALSKGK